MKQRIFLSERIPDPLSEGHVLDVWDRPDKIEFRDWLLAGYRNGWIGAPICHTHDGLPTTKEEDEEDEPCVHILRLHLDKEERRGVVENHLPSEWRNRMFDLHDM